MEHLYYKNISLGFKKKCFKMKFAFNLGQIIKLMTQEMQISVFKTSGEID
jgi:hypothetical protein